MNYTGTFTASDSRYATCSSTINAANDYITAGYEQWMPIQKMCESISCDTYDHMSNHMKEEIAEEVAKKLYTLMQKIIDMQITEEEFMKALTEE